jgi:hypothetical protein
MTETIYGIFDTVSQAQAAEAELSESGVSEADMRFDESGLKLTVIAKVEAAIDVRTVIERHGGQTEVDNLPDAGSIPSDPLEYSDDPPN